MSGTFKIESDDPGGAGISLDVTEGESRVAFAAYILALCHHFHACPQDLAISLGIDPDELQAEHSALVIRVFSSRIEDFHVGAEA